MYIDLFAEVQIVPVTVSYSLLPDENFLTYNPAKNHIKKIGKPRPCQTCNWHRRLARGCMS